MKRVGSREFDGYVALVFAEKVKNLLLVAFGYVKDEGAQTEIVVFLVIIPNDCSSNCDECALFGFAYSYA